MHKDKEEILSDIGQDLRKILERNIGMVQTKEVEENVRGQITDYLFNLSTLMRKNTLPEVEVGRQENLVLVNFLNKDTGERLETLGDLLEYMDQ